MDSLAHCKYKVIIYNDMFEFVNQIKLRLDRKYKFDYSVMFKYDNTGFICENTNEFICCNDWKYIKEFGISQYEYLADPVPIWIENHSKTIDRVLKMRAFI